MEDELRFVINCTVELQRPKLCYRGMCPNPCYNKFLFLLILVRKYYFVQHFLFSKCFVLIAACLSMVGAVYV